MRLRTLTRLAGTSMAAASLALLSPTLPAHAADNCGPAVTFEHSDDISWTSQTCLRNEVAFGSVPYLRGLGIATFDLTPAAHADVLRCTVNVWVIDSVDDTIVASGSRDCTAAAQTNGTAVATAGPPEISLPVCVLGHHYYAESAASLTTFGGITYGTGAVRSFSVFC